MAGYRNQTVHFYAEITEREIFNIIQEELQDFSTFCGYIESVLKDPEKYKFSVE